MDLYTILSTELTKKPGVKNHSVARGGTAGVMLQDGTLISEYANQCLRQKLIKAAGILTPNTLRDEITFANGLAWEGVFTALKSSSVWDSFEDQVEVVVQTEHGPWYGTADFVATYKGTKIVLDTKTIQSVGSYVALRAGEVKVDNIAQLLGYMIALDAKVGALACATTFSMSKSFMGKALQEKCGGSITPDMHIITVKIIDAKVLIQSGEVIKYWEYTIEDVLRYRDYQVRMLRDKLVAPRPITPGGSKPCFNCPMFNTCNVFDSGYDKHSDTFIQMVRDAKEGIS